MPDVTDENPYIEWIRRGLLKPGKTQTGIARSLGIAHPQITMLLQGKRRLKVDEIPRIAAYLEEAPPAAEHRPSEAPAVAVQSSDGADMPARAPSAGRMDEPNATPPQPLPAAYGEATIAIYGQAVGGDDGYFVLNGNKIADVLAPPSLRNVKDAYGVYVVGESMEPRYFPGEAVFVNPKLPVRRGDFVVAQIWHREGDENPRCYIKRFVRLNSQELILEQFNPSKELTYPKISVKAIHRIVMSGDG